MRPVRRHRFECVRAAFASAMLVCAVSVAAAQERPAKVDQLVTPGLSTKADVDTSFGEPRRKIADGQFEYAPSTRMADASRLVATYFSDVPQLARLDVYLKEPIAAADLAAMRAAFGTRLLARDRNGGGQDELYTSQLRGLIFDSKALDAPAIGVIFYSPRFLADIYAERFDALLSQRNYAEARSEADKERGIDPDYARGYLDLGRLQLAQNSVDEALASLAAAAKAKYAPSAIADAHLQLITLWGSRKKIAAKALEEMNAVLALPSSTDQRVDAHIRYGKVLEEQKRDADALAEFSTAVNLARGGPVARLALGEHYEHVKDRANANAQYEVVVKAIESPGAPDVLQRDRPRIYFRYAYNLQESGRAAESIPPYEKSLALNRRDKFALNNVGNAYRATGEVAKAIDCFKRALAIDDSYGVAHGNYGHALLDAGQLEEGRREVERGMTLVPNSTSMKIQMTRYWAASGNKKEAIAWLQKAVAAGYHDRAELMADKLLEKIRGDGEFKKLVERMR